MEKIDGIYYYLRENLTAEVSGRGADRYKGHVIIPPTVEHNGVTYNVTRVGGWSFQQCQDLRGVTFPSSIVSIEYKAFCFCTNLREATVPDAVTSIDSLAFAFCDNLRQVTLGSSLTTLGDGVFSYSRRLAKVNLPAGITAIPPKAFECCRSLWQLIIPAGVTSIGPSAFALCSGLVRLYCSCPTPPQVDISAFEGVQRNRCTLYVPEGSKEAYSKAEGWKYFGKKIRERAAPAE